MFCLDIFIETLKITKEDGSEVTLKLEKDALVSAEYADFCDQRFDSCNSRKIAQDKEKPLSEVVTDKSQHHNFWRIAIQKIRNMRYVDRKTLKPLPNPPTLNNWIFTLKGLEDLWKIVRKDGFSHLRTVNQDPIENLFGNLKSHGFRDNTPSCKQAESVLKALMITSLTSTHSLTANCLDDGAVALTSLNVLCQAPNLNSEKSGNRMHDLDFPDQPAEIIPENRSPAVTVNRLRCAKNFAVEFIKKTKIIKDCKHCEALFFCNNPLRNEFVPLMQKYNMKDIKTAAADFFELGFCTAEKAINTQLGRSCWRGNLLLRIKDFLIREKKVSFDWVTCIEHRSIIVHKFYNCIITYCIDRWCNHLNRLLKGQTMINKGTRMEKRAIQAYLAERKQKLGMQKQ